MRSIWSALVGWFRSYVMGHVDEPEPPEGNAPETRAFREKRAAAIRAARVAARKSGKPMAEVIDPATGRPVSRPSMQLALIAPGRRIPWVILDLPDGYTFDDFAHFKPYLADQWRVRLANILIGGYNVMSRRIEEYDRDQAAERQKRAVDEAERRYARAVAREQREARAKEDNAGRARPR